MRALLGILLVVGLGAGVLFATGCASNERVASDEQEAHEYVSGMMCSECETVWVKERRRHGPRMTRLRSVREMTCPTCDATAQQVLQSDGTMKLHDCPTCKVTPTVINVDRVEPKHIHQRTH